MEYCDSCGKAYEIVYDVPDEIWGKITLRDGDGFLCIECADKRAAELGIDLYWSANKGEYLTVVVARLKKEKEWLLSKFTMSCFKASTGYLRYKIEEIRERIVKKMQQALNGSNKNGPDD